MPAGELGGFLYRARLTHSTPWSSDSGSYAKTASLDSSHEATMRAAAALSVTALEVLTSEKFRKELHEAWKKDMKDIDGKKAIERLKSVLVDERSPIPSEKAEEKEAHRNGGSCGCSH